MNDDKSVNDKANVEKVELPEDGGTFTYFEGHPYPFPGFPDQRFVQKTALIKAMIPALCRGAKYLIDSDKIDPKRYSRPVREIYRLFNLLIEREKDKGNKEKWTQIRDVVCYILEFDSAYRFRLQDVLKEINLDEIKPDEATRYYMSLHDDYKFS